MRNELVITALACAMLFTDDRAGAEIARLDPHVSVDRIVVRKSDHSLTLFSGEQVLFKTSAAIGPGGAGHKRMEGDKVTPVGRYHVVSKGPSRYHVFMRLDYPNAEDRARFARAKADGTLPKGATIGSDIGIHGAPPDWKLEHKRVDWTLGCVAVDDDEIAAIARRTQVGTVVDIED